MKKRNMFNLLLVFITITSFNSYSQYTKLTPGGTSPFNFSGAEFEGGNASYSFIIDFDNDNDDDIIIWNGSTWALVRNNGSGSFSYESTTIIDLNTGANAIGFLVFDYEGDGDDDILDPIDGSANQASVWINDGSGNFSELVAGVNSPFNFSNTTFSTGADRQVFALDYDGDGDEDLIGWDGANNWHLILNNGNGSFSEQTGTTLDLNINNNAKDFVLIDYDGDGDIDILDTQEGSVGQAAILRNNGSGSWTKLTAGGTSPINFSNTHFESPGARQCFAIDYDVDGDIDLIAWDGGSDWHLIRNNGNGSFSEEQNTTIGLSSSTIYNIENFLVFDFEGDLDMDILDPVDGAVNQASVLQNTNSPPSITSSTPINEALDFPDNENIILNLSENVTKGSGNIEIRRISDNIAIETIDVNTSAISITNGNEVSINPSSNLPIGTSLYLHIDGGALIDADNESIVSLINNPNELQFTAVTSCSAPSAPATNTVFGSETATTLNLSSFTAPTGDAVTGYAIYINNSNSFTSPNDGDEPTVDTSWNSTGQQAVYFGTSTSPNITITDLTAGDTYYFQIYAYNDCSGTETYENTGLNASDTTNSTLTWDGSSSNDWATADNWTPASIPGSNTDVIIPSVFSNYPTASSPVNVNSVTIASGATLIAQDDFTGTVTYNRSLITTNWYLVSPPVSGEDMTDMRGNNSFANGSGGNRIGFATYTTGTDAWSYFTTSSSDALDNGRGYSAKLSATGDIAFTGTLNTSGVSLAMSTGGNGAFNLFGNPYTSFLAANSNADGTNNLLSINSASLTETTLWFWNQGTSSYDQVNLATPAFYVAPGQGFFVSAANTNNFSFAEAMQSHQSTDSFQKTTPNPEITLHISDGTLSRKSVIYYINGTTTSFDNGYDSSIFGGVSHSFQVYTKVVANNSEKNLGIQSLPNSDYENMVIPIGVVADSGKEITFSLESLNLPFGLKVYLEDRENDSFIRLDEANSEYKITPKNALNSVGRFYLHTRSSALSTNDIVLRGVHIFAPNRTSLNITGVNSTKANLKLYNILGKQVMETSFSSIGNSILNLPNLSTGIYIVQLTTDKGQLNKKIVLE